MKKLIIILAILIGGVAFGQLKVDSVEVYHPKYLGKVGVITDGKTFQKKLDSIDNRYNTGKYILVFCYNDGVRRVQTFTKQTVKEIEEQKG